MGTVFKRMTDIKDIKDMTACENYRHLLQNQEDSAGRRAALKSRSLKP